MHNFWTIFNYSLNDILAALQHVSKSVAFAVFHNHDKYVKNKARNDTLNFTEQNLFLLATALNINPVCKDSDLDKHEWPKNPPINSNTP